MTKAFEAQFGLGVENFVRRNILSDKILSDTVYSLVKKVKWESIDDTIIHHNIFTHPSGTVLCGRWQELEFWWSFLSNL